MKNILVLQHIAIEDPGYIKDLMLADGWQLTQVELDEGESLPEDVDDFDALLVMGGPMDTWMEDDYPWLKPEKTFIHDWVVRRAKPFLGFCLGCQLLGEVLGGKVVRSDTPEIGILDIEMSAAADGDQLFAGFPPTVKALQWHSYEVRNLEHHADVTLLGSSDVTRYQLFRYQQHAYAVQCHFEARASTVRDWGKVPEYKVALEDTLGAGSLDAFNAEAQKYMPEMNRLSTLLYENFKKLL